MPTTFQDREQAFEAKFAHDEEFRFLAYARRDKLFAHWAANRLQLSEVATEALVKEVLAIPNRTAHDRAVLDHIVGALLAHGIRISEADLAKTLSACMQDAIQQLGEAPPHQTGSI